MPLLLLTKYLKPESKKNQPVSPPSKKLIAGAKGVCQLRMLGRPLGGLMFCFGKGKPLLHLCIRHSLLTLGKSTILLQSLIATHKGRFG
jgi:hypothetical protein